MSTDTVPRPKCSDCSSEMVWKAYGGGIEKPVCPSCREEQREKEQQRIRERRREKYESVGGEHPHRCHGCWRAYSFSELIVHHTSYSPEEVVPMCESCHARLHQREEFLAHLSPEITRKEAMDRDDISLDW